MKNIKYGVTFGVALLCVMLFTACDNNSDSAKTPVIMGKISVSLAGEEAQSQAAAPQMSRTVLPSKVFFRYTYTFTKAGEQNGVVKAPGNDGFFSLEIGSYTVSVKAYTGNAESSLAATGVSSEFSVNYGINDPVEVILTGVGAGATGEFSYTVTYPADAVPEITLQKWPGLNDITLNPVNISQGNGKTQTLQLEAGSYLLTVLVSKNELYTGISEALHIYPSLATEYTNHFDVSDFVAGLPPMVNNYNISGTGTFTYDGNAKTASITRKEHASPGAITILYNGTTASPINAGTYTVTFNVAATEYWNAANGLPAGVIIINKAGGAAVGPITGTSSVTSTSITVNTVTAPSSGQTVEYAKNTSNSTTGVTWQAGTTFSGLEPETTYYFFARSAQNTNFDAGTPSAGLSATTPKPNYRISLNPSGTHTFTAAAYGYGAQSARSVTVNNTGINATGTLAVALSGTNASTYFTLSTTSISSIAAGGNATFTVVPNTGLNAGTYTATVTVSGSNSISASFSVSFTVNRAGGVAVGPITGTSSITGNSVTINAVAAPANGQTVEYARNTSNSTTGVTWQTGTTFTGLTAGTTYYFFARSAQSTNYNAGTASSGYQVATRSITPLTENVWTDGSITSGVSDVYYSFNVTSGTTYYVWWNDSKQGNSKTLDVTVSAAYSNGTSIFTNVDSGYTTPREFTASSSGTVHITVTPYTSGGTGTFAVTYSTSTPITPYAITTTSEWNQALTAVRNGGSGTTAVPKSYTFNIGGSFTVPGLVTNSASTGFGTVTNIVVTLKGSGTISLNSTGRIVHINSGQRLVIDSGNLTLKGIAGNDYYLLGVENGGYLELKNGIINGNGNARGGVDVVSGGSFTMSGGEISGNTAGSGGGVYSSGSFTMSGGKISGNTATATSTSYGGGGVYSFGSFTMSGGEISGNTSSSSGGGVYVDPSGSFTMTGGEISGNAAAGSGGGVYVYSNFTMSGTAKISNNTSSSSGGGVYFYSSRTFTMSGGEISGNTANSYAGGVYVYDGNFTMNGTAKISNNTVNSSNSSSSYNSGGVYVNNNGTFTMSGGEITGNKNNGTSANASGGVFISSGTFTMSGGSVTGNTNAYNTSSSADMFIASTFNLSGGSSIGSLTLYATSTTTQYPITLTGAFTGSVTQLNLSGNNSTITTVINYWVGKAVLKGGSSYTLTTADATKFNNVLGEFRYSGGTTRQSIKSDTPACKIGEYSPDVGNLIYN
jgi:hypothetical protein